MPQDGPPEPQGALLVAEAIVAHVEVEESPERAAGVEMVTFAKFSQAPTVAGKVLSSIIADDLTMMHVTPHGLRVLRIGGPPVLVPWPNVIYCALT
jgi:hypothetical protein